MTWKNACILALLVVGACAHIDYVGKSYPVTARVDLFFSEEEVTQPYELMGKVIATGGDGVSAEKMQDQIMDKAQKKGADAVVITGLERHKSGENTNYNETTKQKDPKTTTTTGGSSTDSKSEKQITALFLKYK
ncbi:MAG: hypothetical protein ACRENN_04560 [Candidatus Eiseniibacteriota bacterium]